MQGLREESGSGTMIASLFCCLQQECEMVTSVYFFLGFVFGFAGMLRIGEEPVAGSGALLVSGLLVMAGIDRLCRGENETNN